MKYVYLVQHENVRSGDIKIIGAFSSRKLAQEAVKYLRLKEGFSFSKRGFFVDKYELDKRHWDNGFVTIFHEEVSP